MMKSTASDPLIPQKSDSTSKPMPFSARTGCLLVGLAGSVLVLICLASAQLLAQGEIRWGRGDLRENRIWLLREGEAQGLAYSHMRIVSGSEGEGQVCVESQVDFWLWSGGEESPGTAYCECFQVKDGGWISNGACSP
jgi:hypothetical protein